MSDTTTKPGLEKLKVADVINNSDGSPRGHIRGELLTLRPVLKGDLPALAGMLGEDPLPRSNGPWTLTKLEKKFDDEKKPGLWCDEDLIYVACAPDGAVCGYVQQKNDQCPGCYCAGYWIARGHPQRDAAGRELVALHMRLLDYWQRARRVYAQTLEGEEARPAWLAAAGFEPDYVAAGALFRQGRGRAMHNWVRLDSELRASASLSSGEPAESAAATAVTDWNAPEVVHSPDFASIGNVLEGRLVRLRPFVNAEEYSAMGLEQGIDINAHWGSWFQPVDSIKKDFAENGGLSAGGYNTLALERLDTGELIGYEDFGLELPQRAGAWIGTYVMPRHQGRRFGVEAKQLIFCYLFENFPIEQIYTDTVETHLGAARGLKLSGMNYHGRRRLRSIRDGRFVDQVLYSLTRSAWEKMPYRNKVRRSAYWYGYGERPVNSAQ